MWVQHCSQHQAQKLWATLGKVFSATVTHSTGGESGRCWSLNIFWVPASTFGDNSLSTQLGCIPFPVFLLKPNYSAKRNPRSEWQYLASINNLSRNTFNENHHPPRAGQCWALILVTEVIDRCSSYSASPMENSQSSTVSLTLQILFCVFSLAEKLRLDPLL